jgi:hypothetical protein
LEFDLGSETGATFRGVRPGMNFTEVFYPLGSFHDSTLYAELFPRKIFSAKLSFNPPCAVPNAGRYLSAYEKKHAENFTRS